MIQNVIGVPWSWRFVQWSLALFSLCKKLIQTKRIFLFFLKLNWPVTPLSAICARELLVRLEPRDRRVVITQQEKVRVTKEFVAVIMASRTPSFWKRYVTIQFTAAGKKLAEIQFMTFGLQWQEFAPSSWETHLLVCTSFSKSSPYTSRSIFLLGR